MNNSHNKLRLTYSLFFVLISQMLLAQTWEEVKMQVLPDDTMDFHWSSNICFTNKDTGWISTIEAEENESGNYDLIRKIFRTQNGGNTWIIKFINSQKFNVEYTDTYSIYSMEPDYFIAMYNDSVAGALISEDGGETWIDRRISDEHLSSRIYKIYFFDKLNGIAFSEDRWFTADGGYTWEKSNDTFDNFPPSDVCFVNDCLGWIVSTGNKYATDSGYLANTIDGGKTWQYQDSLAAMLSGVDFIDLLKGFAVGTSYPFSTAFIYSTIDSGENWNIKSFYGEGSYKDIGFLDDKHGWILASGGRILRTCDGGENWETQIDSLDCNFGKLRILKADRMAYAVGYNMDYHTLVIYRADLSGLTVIDNEDISIPEEICLYQNYPNPFNSQTTIRYMIYQNTHVELKIFNILGEEVRTLINKNQNPGNYQVRWDGKSNSDKPLESGIYICQLVMNGRMERRKIILLK
ncbi:MAG: T9SS type A sorting domain-containing protein [Candidatus Marinimicrobia bacterium]|nr:T9SS type A sorting domain-containing protein [Candidatus Neomarinimicrobiota bacterium]